MTTGNHGMEAMWHYATNDDLVEGPVSETALQRMFSVGHVNGGTLIWREGLPDWTAFEQVFKREVRVTPPPLPGRGSAGKEIREESADAPDDEEAVPAAAVDEQKTDVQHDARYYSDWVRPIPEKEKGTFERAIEVGMTVVIAGMGLALLDRVGMTAVPAYGDFRARGQVEEALQVALPFKDTVDRALRENIDLRRLNNEGLGIGRSPMSRYVQEIEVAGGRMWILLGPFLDDRLANRVIGLQAFREPDGSISWTCGYGHNASGRPIGLDSWSRQPIYTARFRNAEWVEERLLPEYCQR